MAPYRILLMGASYGSLLASKFMFGGHLLHLVATSKVTCMSIMNMPPLPYVKRIPGLNYDALKPAYTDPDVWDNFEPGLLTLCSPDPQAIRPPEEKVNVLQVTLPTN